MGRCDQCGQFMDMQGGTCPNCEDKMLSTAPDKSEPQPGLIPQGDLWPGAIIGPEGD